MDGKRPTVHGNKSDPEASGLAAFAAGLKWEDIPTSVRHEAKRALLNMFATAFAGCGEPAVEKALAVMSRFSGDPQASLFGRGQRRDAALAAFVNAMAANIHDYDDTHPGTIIHPTAPVAPALLAFAETAPRTGADLLRAFLIGAEIECRIGNAVSPGHYTRGWHITSTCGVFGAAAGVGALLGLEPQQFVWAFGNASVQSAGLVEALGTMSKSISVGNAARNGLFSALLAKEGFAGPSGPLSGSRGFLRVYCDEPKFGKLLDGLGDAWEIARNTYKPYPVGVVLNPVIDASLQLASLDGFRADKAVTVELTGHPLLRQRTDRPDVRTGRESQVSAQHAIAIVWRRGKAGLDEFDDAAVAETLAAGRPEVNYIDDPVRDVSSVGMAVRMRDGATFRAEISAARGSPENPLSDSDLERKLMSMAHRIGFTGNVGALIDAVWALDKLADAAVVSRLANPAGTSDV